MLSKKGDGMMRTCVARERRCRVPSTVWYVCAIACHIPWSPSFNYSSETSD